MVHSTPTRQLHLIDIENLIGRPRPSESEVRACAHRYQAVANAAPTDLMVVACNHGAALDVALGWPTRLLQRSGPSGADLALLDVLQHEHVDDRFVGVIIGSGDGVFAEAVAELGAAGVSVSVVSRRRSLSKRLALAAKHVVYLDAPRPPAVALRVSRVA